MSEASESLHFWHATPADVRTIALAAGAAGRIVAHNEHWVTFVPFDADHVMTMACSAPGLCLRWIYFEDFGLGLEFIEAGTEFGRAGFHWEPDQESRYSGSLELELRKRGVPMPLESLAELARSVPDHAEPREPFRDRVAALLGIPAYDWLSPSGVLDTPVETEQQRFPDAEDVE